MSSHIGATGVALYPGFAERNSTAHWYGKWKTARDVHGPFWRKAAGPTRVDRDRPTPWTRRIPPDCGRHAPRITGSSLTVKVCLSCLWVTENLDEEHH